MNTYWDADSRMVFLCILFTVSLITTMVALTFYDLQIEKMELQVMAVEAEALQEAVDQGSPVSVTYIKTRRGD